MAKIKTGPKVKRKGGGVAAKSRKVDSLACCPKNLHNFHFIHSLLEG